MSSFLPACLPPSLPRHWWLLALLELGHRETHAWILPRRFPSPGRAAELGQTFPEPVAGRQQRFTPVCDFCIAAAGAGQHVHIPRPRPEARHRLRAPNSQTNARVDYEHMREQHSSVLLESFFSAESACASSRRWEVEHSQQRLQHLQVI